MNKDEFTEHLRKLGYNARKCADGVIVFVESADLINPTYDRVFRKEAALCDFNESGGCSARRDE